MDKYYRLMRGFNWWPDEQPSDEIKEACWHKMEECGFVVDTVLSHTCPYKYIPREAFLPMINQDSVDDSTEKWPGVKFCVSDFRQSQEWRWKAGRILA